MLDLWVDVENLVICITQNVLLMGMNEGEVNFLQVGSVSSKEPWVTIFRSIIPNLTNLLQRVKVLQLSLKKSTVRPKSGIAIISACYTGNLT